MPEPVRIRFTAEVAQAVARIREVATGFAATGKEARSASETIVSSARAQVDAMVKQRAELRLNVEAYATLAKAAKRGSDEQVAANELARRSAQQLGESYLAAGRAAATGAAQAARANKRGAEESGLVRGFASRAGGMTAFAGTAFIAGAVGGVLVKKAADEAQRSQESQRQLAQAAKNVGINYNAARKSTEEWLVAQEKLSDYDRVTLRTNLTSLLRVTGNLHDAQNLLSTAENVARGRHIDLANAVMIVTRAHQGNAGMLRRLGIDVPKVTAAEDALRAAHIKTNPVLAARAKELDKQATATKAMALLDARYKDSAATHSKTLQGREEALGNTIRELAVRVGTAATPALTKFVTWMANSITAAMNSEKVHRILHQTLKVLSAAWTGLSTVIRAAIDVVKFLSSHVKSVLIPILAVGLVGAIAAVRLGMISLEMSMPWMAIAAGAILAVGYIVKYWKPIERFFGTVWDYIKRTGDAAWELMKQSARAAVYAILQYATAALRGVLEIASHLPFIGGKAKAALNAINGYLATWKPDFSKVAQAFAQGGTDAGNAFASAAEGALTSGVAAGLVGGARGTAQQANPKAAGQVGGTQFALTHAARALGVGSGGTYAKGGGHGGVVRPGHVLDCSGYTYQVYTQSGFQDFPGTSETQWSTHSGPNWTSEVIPANMAAPGDLVFMVGSSEYPPPGHVGIVVSGSGASAQVMQYYSTGAPADVIPLASIGDLIGVKRYYLATKDTRTSKPKSKSPKSAVADTQAAFDAALAGAAKKTKKTAGLLKQPTLIGLQGHIDAELRAVPKQTDAIERSAIEHIKKIRDALHVGMTSTELAKDRVELAKWGKVLHDEIHKNAEAARKAAAAAKKKLHDAAAEAATAWKNGWQENVQKIDRAVSESWALVQRGFDRETQATLTQMGRATQAGLTQLQRAFQAQMDRFDKETQSGLDKLVVEQTPEEKALADFQAKRSADQLAATKATEQSDLAAAIASGDPAQIKSAQDAINSTLLDEQEAALQAQAELSRKSADEKTKQQQDDYQAQRDALKLSLSDQEALLEQSYQDTADAAAQAYQDQRDAQWQHLNDLHDDQATAFDNDLQMWGIWLSKKQKTWASFLLWLQQNPVSASVDGSASGVTDPSKISGGGGSYPPLTQPGAKPGAGRIAVAAKGGWIPGSLSVTRDSVPLLAMPGEYVMSRREVQRGAPDWSSGGGDGHTTIIYGTFLGATERQVGRALDGLVTPAQRRVVRYKAPL